MGSRQNNFKAQSKDTDILLISYYAKPDMLKSRIIKLVKICELITQTYIDPYVIIYSVLNLKRDE